jgi:peptide/nickel transport system permease protein
MLSLFPDVEPVLLWTDALIYLLIAAVIGVGWYARSREHLLTPWREVLRKPLGMSALLVLVVYLFIGLADSIHYKPRIGEDANGQSQYAAQIWSVLDAALRTLKDQGEKTYSAPFAVQLYMKETIEDSAGKTRREFPRLQYGGGHLTDPMRERAADVWWRVTHGIGAGLMGGVGMILLVSGLLSFRYREPWLSVLITMFKGQRNLPWRSLFAMVVTIVIFLGFLISTAGYYHVFGTDKVGEDVLYQSLKSIRTGLVIGTLTTLVLLPFAILLGIMAGYFKGWVDDVIQYIYTTLNSIPGVLLIAAAVLMMLVYMETHPEMFGTGVERADFRLLFLCIILGVTSWTGLCRLLRAETLKLRELEYVQAATALGVRHFTIILRHVLPNVMHIVLIAVVMDFSALVLAEAVLSYLNIGVDPATYSWGNMINSARLEMAREPIVWWSLFAAFLFMFLLVLSANLFADAVRDAFDPRLRDHRG